ncbi:hypothetical protein Dsin_006359 [Dipteronia sinensis]|uniref:Uncharacterized protein n=1 Tax=Dipteronia sinensis TaxID=43782 RepID=A0AAE0AZG7_9ROSI|nr:hypothetical protein Dsin_006359 [Dipteronia sinensis]
MSLKESEGPQMPLQVDLKTDREKRLALRVVGHIMSNKMVNTDTFIRLMPTFWRIIEEVEIEVISGNMIGDVQDIDLSLTGECVRKYIRMRSGPSRSRWREARRDSRIGGKTLHNITSVSKHNVSGTFKSGDEDGGIGWRQNHKMETGRDRDHSSPKRS